MTNQKYKFFVNNKVVILCENPAQIDTYFDEEDSYIVNKYTSLQQLKTVVDVLLGNMNESNFILFHSDVEKLKNDFLSLFVCIEAAGGVVFNENKEILLIFRRGSWDLPKGKVDPGETLRQTAIREVQEETGLMELEIIKPINFEPYSNVATYHSYAYKGKEAMKIAHWFTMHYYGNTLPIAQTEEDIERAIWVKPKDISSYFENMYPSIRDVLNRIF